MKHQTSDQLGLSAQPPQTPWFLRLAGAVNLKGIAATAGLAALYGLLFVGLLLAPLLPHLAAQSNSPTNNSPTNSVSTPPPTDHPTGLGAFDAARSTTDCYIIYMRVRMKKQDFFDDLLAPHRTTYQEAQEECDERRKIELNQNNLQHFAAMKRAESDYYSTLLTCLGLGAFLTHQAGSRSHRWAVTRQGNRVALSRVAGGLATAVVGVGSFLGCNRLANRSRNHAEGVANQLKVGDDRLTELDYQKCVKDTVKPHKDKYDAVMRSRNTRLAKIDDNYRKCAEFFRNQEGDCGTND